MDDRARLGHIREAVQRILRYTKSGRQEFFNDTMIQDAVVRNFEIIGEAVKNLSEEFRSSHGEIRWPKVSRMRDVLVHRYFGVRLETVWETVERRLPELLRVVDVALGKGH